MRLLSCRPGQDFLRTGGWPEWETALLWGGELPGPKSPPCVPTKAPRWSNILKKIPFAVLRCVYSLPSQVERLVMCISAHQVPAMANNPNAFLGSSVSFPQGWLDPKSVSQLSPLPSVSTGPGLMPRSKSACEAWLLPLPPASFFCHPLPHTIHSATLKSLQVHECVLISFVSLHLPVQFLVSVSRVLLSHPSRFTQHISKLMTWI